MLYHFQLGWVNTFSQFCQIWNYIKLCMLFSFFFLWQKINQSHLQSTKSHREIARHQASSSVFSWQQEKAPSCPSSSNQETPLKRSFSTSNFPWEQETTPSHSGLRSEKKDFNRSFSNNSNNSPVIDRLKAQNQGILHSVTMSLNVILRGI